jgi:hypothetical protein
LSFALGSERLKRDFEDDVLVVRTVTVMELIILSAASLSWEGMKLGGYYFSFMNASTRRRSSSIKLTINKCSNRPVNCIRKTKAMYSPHLCLAACNLFLRHIK